MKNYIFLFSILLLFKSCREEKVSCCNSNVKESYSKELICFEEFSIGDKLSDVTKYVKDLKIQMDENLLEFYEECSGDKWAIALDTVKYQYSDSSYLGYTNKKFIFCDSLLINYSIEFEFPGVIEKADFLEVVESKYDCLNHLSLMEGSNRNQVEFNTDYRVNLFPKDSSKVTQLIFHWNVKK